MTIQLSTAVRNAMLDVIESTTGATAKLRLLTGAVEANCAAAETGTLLCQITVPSDWMSAASAGVKTLLGTWSGTGAAAGTAAHFRLVDNAGTTCHMQGTITATGGGGDLTLDNVVIAVAQAVNITGFTLTAPNP